ncbi:MAG TPA: hypothetical protein VF033_14820 [Steroidobacteraceae bacterium]|jgi:hypothetical protein
MNLFKRTLALTLSTVFLVTGCAQLQNVPLARTEQGVTRPDIQVGDRVVVTTQDGARHKFQVLAVEADALRGARDRVAYADMQELGVRKPGDMHLNKTAMIVGAVVLGAVAIGAASGGGGSSGY